MSLHSNTFAAPWGRSLKVMTVLGSGVLAGVALLEGWAIPRDLLGGWPWAVATFLPAAVLAGGWLFTIRGYALEPGALRVRRPLWDTVVPLDGLRSAWASPEAMKGSLRLFGNGGLFSITGLFRNARLGNYRAFAMDPRRSVVLELPSRKVVVTPDSPAEFLEQLRLVSPGAEVRRGSW